MKALTSAAILGASLMAIYAQDVFVLGGPGSTPVPPIVYQPPIVTGAPTYYTAIPVASRCATPAYAAPYYASYYRDPNVIYIGGPGSCGPRYYDYPPCSTPNVIYFGREQAYRHGYNF